MIPCLENRTGGGMSRLSGDVVKQRLRLSAVPPGILAFLAATFFCAAPAAGTDVSGDITTNTTWDVTGSPYVLVGNICVRSGATLTVEPDVEVQLGAYDIKLGYLSTLHGSNGYLVSDAGTFICGVGRIRLDRGGVTLTGCALEGDGSGSGITFYCETGGGSISECTLSGFTYPFFVINGNHWFTDNDVSGCTHQVVAVGGDYLHYNTTWRSSWGLPVRLLNAIKITAATLTVEPGVEVELGNQVLWVGYHDNGTLTADGATFTGGSGYIYLYRGSLTLTGCDLVGGGGSSAVQLYSLDGYGSSSISDCVISGYTYPYYVISGNHWFTDNDVSGCTHQVVAVGGDYLHYNTTWRSSWGLPVRLLNAIKITAATLTVEPGVEVELGNQVLWVGYHDNGTLTADGATFTGGSGYIYLYRGH